jgi:hypothetical protein
MNKKIASLLLLLGTLAACSGIPLHEEAGTIQLHWVAPDLSGCEFKGEIVGSQGSWYDFWLISNPSLTHGALNDLKNAALAQGGNVVVALRFQDFATSVTFLGQAYDCPPEVVNTLR